MTQQSINPTTGEAFADYPSHTDAEIQQAVAVALEAFGVWREQSLADRAEPLLRAAERLVTDADRYARLMAMEMGDCRSKNG